jgi:nitroimidazol reductase NimA-like FMN-containing flavoprotein (pyridoxamine 5'-phosphate oxidase superfamily)
MSALCSSVGPLLVTGEGKAPARLTGALSSGIAETHRPTWRGDLEPASVNPLFVRYVPDRMDARELIAANRYMALATADAAGRPWISPVWFAPDDGGFLWISRPDSRHSRNLAERPELALVIYDSTVRPAERQALYVEAVAQQLEGDRRDAAVGRYSECSVADGLEPLSVDEVTESAPYRMYRAAITAAFMLEDQRDVRIPVEL